MASTSELRLSPQDVIDVTKQLDELAARIERLMATEAPNLATTAAGRDEVSQRVASTLNDVHGAFAKSTDDGVAEIRQISATLHAHTDRIVDAEQDFAA